MYRVTVKNWGKSDQLTAKSDMNIHCWMGWL